MESIATKVYQKLGSRFGVNQTPTHNHNDIDSSKLSPSSLTNTSTLSAQTGGVLNGKIVSNIPAPVVVYPIPVITSAPTGTAPVGTLMYNSSVSFTGLYIYLDTGWTII